MSNKLTEILYGAWIIRCEIVNVRNVGGLYIEEDLRLRETVSNELEQDYERKVELRIKKIWKKTNRVGTK